jgi:hypothetical protein
MRSCKNLSQHESADGESTLNREPMARLAADETDDGRALPFHWPINHFSNPGL